jgi:hypothetical protein
MKHQFLAAAALALLAGQAMATTYSEASYFDADAFVYGFGASQITPADALGEFTFTLNASDSGFSQLAGLYNVSGDISGNKFAISSVKINGVAWDLSGGTNNVDLGTLAFPAVTSIELAVKGARLGSGSNFQGSLVLTSAVPEPGTYALMMVGLLAMGAVVRRRTNKA